VTNVTELTKAKDAHPAGKKRTCIFDGCSRPLEARGYCRGHYRQQQRGNPLVPLRADVTLSERMEAQTDKSVDCWVWTASTNEDGYGCIRVGGKMMKAHRVAYEMEHGAIPEGMQVDHRCHTPACVRPDHLRLATNKQNQENRAGAQANSKSGVRGVYWKAEKRKWCAQVRHNGRLIHLGYFATIEEAEVVVIAKRLELFTYNDADFVDFQHGRKSA